jgi:hypothetical protein
MKLRSNVVGLLVALLVAIPTPCSLAGILVLNATNRGWYQDTGFHDATNTNYAVGQTAHNGVGPGSVFHDFFVFSLPASAASISAAHLRVFEPDNGYFSSHASETVTLYDVSTAPSTVAAAHSAGAAGQAVYNDLADGTTFGARTVSAADNATTVDFSLNSDALVALNAANGQFWAVGGAIAITLPPGNDQTVFGLSTSSDPTVVQLVLTVPEPSTFALAALAIVTLASALHRRNR